MCHFDKNLLLELFFFSVVLNIGMKLPIFVYYNNSYRIQISLTVELIYYNSHFCTITGKSNNSLSNIVKGMKLILQFEN